ncbi:MAG: polysaccharide deacetylase family protein [Polaribacter sp.]|nr:polysaccharide deacetylase family protein [Polaribacter sp.]
MKIFKKLLLLIFVVFLTNFSKSEKNGAEKVNWKINYNQKNDSLPLIPNQFLDFQKNSQGFCITKGDSTKKQIALTFDDGPTEVSKKIIKILDRYKAKGTFFWVGERIKENPSVIDIAQKNGHLIANHSWNHENGWTFSNEQLWQNQVEKCNTELSNYGVKNVRYFRPPFGAITQNQIDFLASKNIKTVLWSITTNDWDPKENKEGQLFEKFKNYIHNGAVVLMHDFDYSNLDAKLKDLEKMLQYGIKNGYKFVTVETIL